MESLRSEHSGAAVLYLGRQEVVDCCAGLDPVAITTDALKAHAKGDTTIPEEAYLGWETPSGHSARSLGMPGGIRAGGSHRLGLKVINASLGNVARGLPRSQGFTMIFDPETARPMVIMEAAYISALRTAAVTTVAAKHLGRSGLTTAALIGCGTLAKAHLALLPSALPTLRQVRLFDLDAGRAETLAGALRTDPLTRYLDTMVTSDPRDCVRGAELVVPVTTVTEGYLPFEWLEPGAVVGHVSLDDVLPDVVAGASLVLVDDWGLVSHDHRRLLGRMYRAGTLLGPDGRHHPDATPDPGARMVDGTLGEVLLGVRPGRRSADDVILVNPFGMSILDIALGAAVHERAVERDLGRWLPI
jgi:ornithine cyclodeaminase/alanine dehydrogenase-like protein (mu-crystallin family)